MPTPHKDTPRKGGAPQGNNNAVRHGLRTGKLPKHLSYVEKRVNIFRRTVEELVVEAKGEVTLTDAAAINSACKWERHGILAQHWLRNEGDKLPLTERLKFSAEIAKASDARDKALRALKLDDTQDTAPWTIAALPAPAANEAQQ